MVLERRYARVTGKRDDVCQQAMVEYVDIRNNSLSGRCKMRKLQVTFGRFAGTRTAVGCMSQPTRGKFGWWREILDEPIKQDASSHRSAHPRRIATGLDRPLLPGRPEICQLSKHSTCGLLLAFADYQYGCLITSSEVVWTIHKVIVIANVC